MIDPAGFFEQAGSPADLPPAELGAAIAMNVKKAEIFLRRNVALIKERGPANRPIPRKTDRGALHLHRHAESVA